MSSKVSSLKTLRLRNETVEYFRGKPLNRYVDSLVELIERGEIEEEGDRLKCGCDVKGFKEVCKRAGCSSDLMMIEIIKGIESEIEG